MSRSTRILIVKGKPRNKKRATLYWRPIRSRINQIVRGYTNRFEDLYGYEMEWDENVEAYVLDSIEEMLRYDRNHILLGTDIPDPKTIINDYRYCDYI